MSLQKILDHAKFLIRLTKATTNSLPKLLNKCTDPELESIVELIYNSSKIDLTSSEQVCVNKCKQLSKYFEKNKNLTRSKVLIQLKKRPLILKRLVACIVSKLILEGLLVGMDN